MTKCIVGLGTAGCSVATEFGKFQEYNKIIRIDTEKRQKTLKCQDLYFPAQINPEDYETNVPDFRSKFQKLKDVLLIIVGSGDISLAALALLEQFPLKEKLDILYVQPEKSFLSDLDQTKEKFVFNVLQEYARSGMFRRLILASNEVIEKNFFDFLSVNSYFNKLNNVIVSSVRLCDKFNGMKPVLSSFGDLPVGNRISALAVMDPETFEEKPLFDLWNIDNSKYHFAFHESEFDKFDVASKIKFFMKEKLDAEKKKIYYGLYASTIEQPFAISEHFASFVQSEYELLIKENKL